MSENLKPLKEGILYERTDFLKLWRKRYFVLTEKGLLLSFKTNKDYAKGEKPLETISLASFYCILNADKLTGYPFTFKMSNPKGRVKILRASSEIGRKQWMNLFSQLLEGGETVETRSQSTKLNLSSNDLDEWLVVDSLEKEFKTGSSTEILEQPEIVLAHLDRQRRLENLASKVKKLSPNVFSKDRLEYFFENFRDDDDEDVIGPAGVEALCTSLNVNPEDVSVLVLAFHLKASRMGYFTRSEFMNGLEKLQIDSLEKLKSSIKTFPKELDNNFFNIYKWTFDFAKDDSEKRGMDKTLAAEFFELVAKNRKDMPHVPQFCQFLREGCGDVAINLDLWVQFFHFNKNVALSLNNYNPMDSAWPCLLDEYCEWVKGGKKPRLEKSQMDDEEEEE